MSRKSSKLRFINSDKGGYHRLKLLKDLKYRLVFEGVLVGLAVGVVISLFRLILSNMDGIRNFVIEKAKSGIGFAALAIVILVVLGLVLMYCMKKEELTRGSGIPQVKGELEGRVKSVWWRVLVYKFVATICAIAAGLSLGHEGPSIQLGAMTGKGVARLTGRHSSEEKYLLICGAGAGIAAAFGAPLAGVVFVLEEYRRKFSHKALLSTMAAGITSDWVASSIFGLKPIFEIHLTGNGITLSHYWLIVIFGLLVGVFGWLHNWLIEKLKAVLGKVKPVLKAVIAGVLIICLAIWYPMVLGSGHELVGYSDEITSTAAMLAVLLIAKLLFSTFSSATGASGGVLLPLLVMGAVAGALFTKTFSPLLGYDPCVPYYIILGMAGFFSAIVRAPITGIVLISEMTGAITNLLPLSVVSLIAYVVAELMGATPIYEHPYSNVTVPMRHEFEENAHEIGEK